MKKVRIGTCGWSYQGWSGVFYPKGTAAGDFLSFYAERYPVVEVDSTFYRTPSRKMVEGWRDKTPDGFGFSLKVPQVITHEKLLADCQAEVDAFLSAVRLLEDKLLCCCLQFGLAAYRSKFGSPPTNPIGFDHVCLSFNHCAIRWERHVHEQILPPLGTELHRHSIEGGSGRGALQSPSPISRRGHQGYTRSDRQVAK
jgi:hypothetical protein